MKINLIKSNERYEVEMPTLIQVIQKIKSVKGFKSDPKTRIYSIPKSEKKHLLELLKPLAKVDVKEVRDIEVIEIGIEKNEDKMLAHVSNYFKVSKQLDPVFDLFKSITGRKYEPDIHKWSFPVEEEETLKNGFINLIDEKKCLINCAFF